jgi:hypothetical protein
MRKLMFALLIAAGLAAPMAVPANAGYCISNCNPAGCNVFCI